MMACTLQAVIQEQAEEVGLRMIRGMATENPQMVRAVQVAAAAMTAVVAVSAFKEKGRAVNVAQ